MANPTSFLNGRVTLHAGDCLAVLPTLAENSVDSVVTDPPYALVSITKRFGKSNSAPAKSNGPTGVYARASSGFMGANWDTGKTVFSTETWEAVLRVLKPGAHLVAFGGTRTYHRLASAVEDAGFEIRDAIMWHYGSGFPKSHDVSKGIDRAAGVERELVGTKKITGRNGDVFGQGACAHQTRFKSGKIDVTAPATDSARQWEGWGTALKPATEILVLARKPFAGTVAENVLKHGVGAINIDKCRVELTGQRPYNVQSWEPDQLLCDSCAALAESITRPATPEIKASIATKPVALTSSEREKSTLVATDKTDIGCSDGTKAGDTFINSSTSKSGKTQTAPCPSDTKFTTRTKIEETTSPPICSSCQRPITSDFTRENITAAKRNYRHAESRQEQFVSGSAKGRWPSNVILSDDEEVQSAFPDVHGAGASGYDKERAEYNASAYSATNGKMFRVGDAGGSAARFFYTAKADSDDRIGSKHPTIKPLDLMQYLVRLVTPPKGVVLDCFAGSGTTAEAAWREGFSAILIEREAEYIADIERRMGLCLAGPDERARESIKARLKGKPEDHGPLFSSSLFDEAAE